MKKSEILRERKVLSQLAGRGYYFFFSSILISAGIFLFIAVFLVDKLMQIPEASEVYGRITLAAENSYEKFLLLKVPYYSAAAEAFIKGFLGAIKALPSAAAFFVILIFIVCPIYQGSVRWSAYLIEEKKPLSISAVLFYFISPKLYFSSVFLNIRIFIYKFVSAVLFLVFPVLSFGFGAELGADYYGQRDIAAAVMILSIVWFTLSLVLYFIFCQRYAAVRYLYALGITKKLFSASKRLTKERRVWFFTLKLRLLLNVFLALGIITAPMALSRAICGNCLAVHNVIAKAKSAA